MMHFYDISNGEWREAQPDERTPARPASPVHATELRLMTVDEAAAIERDARLGPVVAPALPPRD